MSIKLLLFFDEGHFLQFKGIFLMKEQKEAESSHSAHVWIVKDNNRFMFHSKVDSNKTKHLEILRATREKSERAT